MKPHNWIIVILGGWLVISPWILGFSGINLALWNAIGVGALVAILALWDLEPPK